MSEFVNYNKRGITLPPGCKDLSDLLKPKGLRNAPGPIPAVEQPPVVREETLTATLAEIEQHVAMVFQSQARLFALEIFLPGEPASVQIIRWERMEISASVVFGKGAEPERAMRAFFEKHGLQPPKDPEPPGAFDTDMAFSLVYRILPLPSGPQPLSEIVTALFRDLRGVDDKGEIRFHYFEMTT